MKVFSEEYWLEVARVQDDIKWKIHATKGAPHVFEVVHDEAEWEFLSLDNFHEAARLAPRALALAIVRARCARG